MAATLSRLVLKRSSVSGAVPDSSYLNEGELALNFVDGRLFYKDHLGNINSFKNPDALQLSVPPVNGASPIGTAGFFGQFAVVGTPPNTDIYQQVSNTSTYNWVKVPETSDLTSLSNNLSSLTLTVNGHTGSIEQLEEDVTNLQQEIDDLDIPNVSNKVDIIESRQFQVTNTTNSSSGTTGAIRTSGGIGAEGNINALGYITAGAGSIIGFDGRARFESPDTNTIWVRNSANNAFADIRGHNFIVSSTTASSSSSTGALTVAGGAGIAGSMYVGGGVSVSGSVISSGKIQTLDDIQVGVTKSVIFQAGGQLKNTSSGNFSFFNIDGATLANVTSAQITLGSSPNNFLIVPDNGELSISKAEETPSRIYHRRLFLNDSSDHRVPVNMFPGVQYLRYLGAPAGQSLHQMPTVGIPFGTQIKINCFLQNTSLSGRTEHIYELRQSTSPTSTDRCAPLWVYPNDWNSSSNPRVWVKVVGSSPDIGRYTSNNLSSLVNSNQTVFVASWGTTSDYEVNNATRPARGATSHTFVLPPGGGRFVALDPVSLTISVGSNSLGDYHFEGPFTSIIFNESFTKPYGGTIRIIGNKQIFTGNLFAFGTTTLSNTSVEFHNCKIQSLICGTDTQMYQCEGMGNNYFLQNIPGGGGSGGGGDIDVNYNLTAYNSTLRGNWFGKDFRAYNSQMFNTNKGAGWQNTFETQLTYINN